MQILKRLSRFRYVVLMERFTHKKRKHGLTMRIPHLSIRSPILDSSSDGSRKITILDPLQTAPLELPLNHQKSSQA